ncbi:hypothetical protein HK101_005083 [Irineochytrium annulatum]|nr:hypothetical protein HK101_005083 [Irineochytrium annulatum]
MHCGRAIAGSRRRIGILQLAGVNNVLIGERLTYSMPGKDDKNDKKKAPAQAKPQAAAAAKAEAPAEATSPKPAAGALSKPKGPRPDKEAHEREISAIKDQIDAIQKKLKDVQDRINGTDNVKDTYDGRRKELRAKLDELGKERSEINDQRTKFLDKLKSIQAGIKKKLHLLNVNLQKDEVRSSKDKLGVRNAEEIDSQVAALEQQITSGGLKLIEEKRIVTEISALKKAKKTLETLGVQSSTVEDDQKEIDALRTQLDALNPRKDEINKQYDEIKATLKEVNDDRSRDQGSFSSLLDEKKSVKQEVDECYEKMRALRAEFKTQNDEWFQWERAERDRRNKEFQDQRKRANDEKVARAAEKELEDANIPAFTEEITTCNNLIAFLEQYTQPGKAATTSATPTKPAVDASLNIRSVDTSVPDGLVMMKKKEDRGEDYLVMGKGKKGKRQGSQAGTPATPTAKTVVKLDLTTMNLFDKLKVDVPITVADCEAALTALEAKKAKFLASQAEQTKKNKEVAEAKIAKIRAKIEAGGSPDDAIKELGGEDE